MLSNDYQVVIIKFAHQSYPEIEKKQNTRIIGWLYYKKDC
jgi:hypothetical protein